MTQPWELSLLPREPVLGDPGSVLTCFPRREGAEGRLSAQEILNHGGKLLGQIRLRGGYGMCPVGYSPVVVFIRGKLPCLSSCVLPSVMLKILGEVQSNSFSNSDANVTYLNSLYNAALIDCSVSLTNSRMVGLFLLFCT